MLSGLDPHSQFMEPDSFKDMQDDTRSRYDGLGLVVSAKDGVLIIVSALEDSPGVPGRTGPAATRSSRSTARPPRRCSFPTLSTALKGKPGDSITMQILRPTSKEVRDFTMVRTEIKVESVKDAHLIDPALTSDYKVGYVRIIQFNEPTAEELSRKLDDLQKAGMQALVLDLRNNPGRTAQQRRRRVRPIPAAQDDGRLHRGPHALCVASANTRRVQRRPTARGFPRGGARQRRQRERCGDRGRGAQGPQPRGAGRGDDLRQGQRAERDRPARRFGGAADHGQILHAE